MGKISTLVDITFDFIYLVLIVGILLSWIVPPTKWQDEPYNTVRVFCDFFFAPFRRIIPPLNGIDFSPILAFIVIGFVGNVLVEILREMRL